VVSDLLCSHTMRWWLAVNHKIKTTRPRRHNVHRCASTDAQRRDSHKLMAIPLVKCIWPRHDLDLWPWKLFRQFPLIRWIFLASFIEIPSPSMKLLRHAKWVLTNNWRTARRTNCECQTCHKNRSQAEMPDLTAKMHQMQFTSGRRPYQSSQRSPRHSTGSWIYRTARKRKGVSQWRERMRRVARPLFGAKWHQCQWWHVSVKCQRIPVDGSMPVKRRLGMR